MPLIQPVSRSIAPLQLHTGACGSALTLRGLEQRNPGLTETRTKHPWTLQSYGDRKLMASGIFPFGIPRANPLRGTFHDPFPPQFRRRGLRLWLRLCPWPRQPRPAPLPLRLWLRPELRLHPGSSLWLQLRIDAGLILHRGRLRPLPFHGYHSTIYHSTTRRR